jgi:hypothetical protein
MMKKLSADLLNVDGVNVAPDLPDIRRHLVDLKFKFRPM